MSKLIIFLALAPALLATDYYVDNAATGSNNGSSWANAWTALDNITWGTGANQVGPGDTVYISGGSTSKTYRPGATGYILNVGVSGTEGNPVTVRVGQDSGHNGNVIFNCGATNGPALGIWNEYITIDGSVGGQIHWFLTNGNMSVEGTGGGNEYCKAINGNGSYFDIKYLDIATFQIGMSEHDGNGGRISYCYFHDIRGDSAIDLSARNGDGASPGYDKTFVNNNTIQLNTTGTEGLGPDGIQGCWGLTVYSNHFYSLEGAQAFPNHMDFIQISSAYGKFYANIFGTAGDSWLDICAQPGNNQTVHHYLIYNNIFRASRGGFKNLARLYTWGEPIICYTNLWICNNTFVDGGWNGNPVGEHALQFSSAGNPYVRDVHILNNIIYNCGTAGNGSVPILIESSTGWVASDWDINFNAVNAGADGNATIEVDGGTFTQANGQTGVPGFVSYTAGATNNNYRMLTNDTVCLGNGTNLSSVFTIDFDSTTRAASPTNWTIGAFEGPSVGGGTPPEPPPATPANFRAVHFRAGTVHLRR